MMTLSDAGIARKLARHAALLFLLGLLTGGLVSSAMMGQVNADAHAALASHLNALLGAFWILGVAFTLPFLHYGDQGKRRLGAVVALSVYANWLVTGVKAFLRVAGVGINDEPKNNAIFVALTLTVVLPSLVGAAAWLWGLRGALPRSGAESAKA